MTWKTEPISKITTLIQTGATPSTKVQEYFHGQIPWFTPSDIGNCRDLLLSERTLSQLGVTEGGGRLVEKDTLLVTCIGNIGRVGITQTPSSFNQQITALRFTNEIDIRYAYYWFLHHPHLLAEHANKAVVPILNNAGLRRILFTYPPIEEQMYIVGILDEVDQARRKRQFTTGISDTFQQDVFMELFGEPLTNPMEWDVDKIGSVVEYSQYGTSNRSNQDGIGYPILGMGNLTNGGKLDMSMFSYVDISEDEFSDLRLEKGDVIFNRTNSTELVGKTTMWDLDIDAVLASYLVKIKLKQEVIPEYFVALLNTPYFKELFRLRCKKAVGQSNISPTYLKTFDIMIPPPDLQAEYASIVQKQEKIIKQQQETARQTEHLFQTLLHQAFRGEL